ncbi:hypothetical protein [Paraburkholderia caffeinilytica]|uniref:hypothetical protein n=1 Tax=Paraburkholderia caffeinilytica TaxID=1761016 RepID=UPI003DA03012
MLSGFALLGAVLVLALMVLVVSSSYGYIATATINTLSLASGGLAGTGVTVLALYAWIYRPWRLPDRGGPAFWLQVGFVVLALYVALYELIALGFFNFH